MQSQTRGHLGRMMSWRTDCALSPQNDTPCRSDWFPAGQRRFPARARTCAGIPPSRSGDRAWRGAVRLLERDRGAGAAGRAGRPRLRGGAGGPGRGDGPEPSCLELATKFREAIEKEFARWEEASDSPQRERSLTLMSESELEVHLAGQQITELLDHQFLHPLAQLDERLRQLSAALGVNRKRPNPLRPEVAVTAFVSLFGPEDLTAGLRSMVFQQFDKRLPKVLGELYEKANKILDDASFSGTSPAPHRQAPRPRPPVQHEPAADHGDE